MRDESRPRAPIDFGALTRSLRRRLARPLPGPRTLRTMWVSDRQWVPVDEARATGCREAAVLVLVYPVDGQARTVVTLRTAHLADHAGQISFPGGRLETGENRQSCALRESSEELGVTPDDLETLGTLTSFYIPPSGFCVAPVVAACVGRPDFRPDPREVAEVIEVPLENLGAANSRVEAWPAAGGHRQVRFYEIGRHKIWGATAMILAELAVVWRDACVSVEPGETT